MTSQPAPLFRSLFWLLLGAWLGAALLFFGGVAPAAFAVAPPPIAGGFVAHVLPPLHWAGVAVGLGATLLLRRQGAARPATVGLALLVAACCAVSELGVSPALEALRPAIRAADPDPTVRSRFGLLHGLSVGLLVASFLAASVLGALQLRAESRRGG